MSKFGFNLRQIDCDHSLLANFRFDFASRATHSGNREWLTFVFVVRAETDPASQRDRQTDNDDTRNDVYKSQVEVKYCPREVFQQRYRHLLTFARRWRPRWPSRRGCPARVSNNAQQIRTLLHLSFTILSLFNIHYVRRSNSAISIVISISLLSYIPYVYLS